MLTAVIVYLSIGALFGLAGSVAFFDSAQSDFQRAVFFLNLVFLWPATIALLFVRLPGDRH